MHLSGNIPPDPPRLRTPPTHGAPPVSLSYIKIYRKLHICMYTLIIHEYTNRLIDMHMSDMYYA